MPLLQKPKVLCILGFFRCVIGCCLLRGAVQLEQGGKGLLYRRIAPPQCLQNQAIKKTEMGSAFKFRWRSR